MYEESSLLTYAILLQKTCAYFSFLKLVKIFMKIVIKILRYFDLKIKIKSIVNKINIMTTGYHVIAEKTNC